MEFYLTVLLRDRPDLHIQALSVLLEGLQEDIRFWRENRK